MGNSRDHTWGILVILDTPLQAQLLNLLEVPAIAYTSQP
jgi:hypothetical protein